MFHNKWPSCMLTCWCKCLVQSSNFTVVGSCRWAFSIWGIIFALQGLGTVYQAMPQGYTPDGWKQRIVNSVGEAPTAACLNSSFPTLRCRLAS